MLFAFIVAVTLTATPPCDAEVKARDAVKTRLAKLDEAARIVDTALARYKDPDARRQWFPGSMARLHEISAGMSVPFKLFAATGNLVALFDTTPESGTPDDINMHLLAARDALNNIIPAAKSELTTADSAVANCKSGKRK